MTWLSAWWLVPIAVIALGLIALSRRPHVTVEEHRRADIYKRQRHAHPADPWEM